MKKKDLAKKMCSPMINGKSKPSQKGKGSLNPAQKNKVDFLGQQSYKEENT